jgi:hypothetical protein
MSDQHLTYLTAPTLPLYQLTTPPLEKEAKEIILKHSCRIEEQESLEKCIIFFPEGTTKTEIFPRTTHPRYQIKLPDGYELRETYDRYQETSLLSYSPE